MSDGNQAAEFIYLMAILVLVISAFMVRKVPIGRGLQMFAGWVIIFLAAFVAFTLKDDFIALGKRVYEEARGGGIVVVQAGETLRIKQSIDGHFWVDAELNGEKVRFLIDSGATMTTVGTATAAASGLDPIGGRGQLVRTGNGVIRVGRARADTITLEGVERRGMTVLVSSNEDINVLGMNWLSSLRRWGVEGRWLILEA